VSSSCAAKLARGQLSAAPAPSPAVCAHSRRLAYPPRRAPAGATRTGWLPARAPAQRADTPLAPRTGTAARTTPETPPAARGRRLPVQGPPAGTGAGAGRLARRAGSGSSARPCSAPQTANAAPPPTRGRLRGRLGHAAGSSGRAPHTASSSRARRRPHSRVRPLRGNACSNAPTFVNWWNSSAKSPYCAGRSSPVSGSCTVRLSVQTQWWIWLATRRALGSRIALRHHPYLHGRLLARLRRRARRLQHQKPLAPVVSEHLLHETPGCQGGNGSFACRGTRASATVAGALLPALEHARVGRSGSRKSTAARRRPPSGLPPSDRISIICACKPSMSWVSSTRV
jgi:hypothetical protein